MVVLIRTNVMAVVLGLPQDSTSAGVSKGPWESHGSFSLAGIKPTPE